MFFVTTVIHPVKELEVASRFFCEVLDFFIKENGEDFKIVENGAVFIRLVKLDDKALTTHLNLELQTRELEKTTNDLLSLTEVSLIREQIPVGIFRVENHLKCPHNLFLTVFKEYNEDELNITPPLPVSLDWDEEVIDCIQQLLKSVPISFREKARIKVTERAEVLAAEQGCIGVEMPQALQAIAESSPSFQHPVLKQALIERGIEPLNYFMDSTT